MVYKLLIHCSVLISAVILPQFGSAKPFSINRALAAKDTASGSELSEADTENVLIKDLKQNLGKGQYFKKGKVYDLHNKTTQFQNQNPFISKPKKLNSKSSHKLINKNKTKSTKRDTEVHHRYGSKYIQLLNDIRLLFNDIFNAHSINLHKEIYSDESKQEDYKDNEFATNQTNVTICRCAYNGQSSIEKQKPEETTVTSTVPTSSKITSYYQDSKTDTSRTDHTSSGNISSIRQNTLLPLLSARNTFSDGGNYYGFGTRSSSIFYPNVERNISRNNGTSEHDTKGEGFTINAESHEEDPNGPSRDYPGSSGQIKLLRGTGDHSRHSNTRAKEDAIQNVTFYAESYEKDSNYPSGDHSSSNDQSKRLQRVGDKFRHTERTRENTIKNGTDEANPFRNTRREFKQYQVQNKSQIGENETRHTACYPQTNEHGKRRLIFDYKNNIHSELNQSQEINEEGISYVEQHSASHQRITDRNFPIASENNRNLSNKKMIGGIPIDIFPTQKVNNNAHVTITDGYSLMRSTNSK